MTDDIFVFDRNIMRQKHKRCAPCFKKHDFLFDWTTKQIIERIGLIQKEFDLALQIGKRSHIPNIKDIKCNQLISIDNSCAFLPDIIADEESLPFSNDIFDMIISPLTLHNTNDLPGALTQIKTSLKKDGLFIGALLGGETLFELRQIMGEVELEYSGGITPRISPFADQPQMGALMQRAGFNLPVIDSEKITVTYENIFKLMEDLRLMGESNIILNRKKTFTPRQFFMDVNTRYLEKFSEPNGRIFATFEIIFLLGWKPHESQQKPLRPGSAKNRLANILETEEKKLPL